MSYLIESRQHDDFTTNEKIVFKAIKYPEINIYIFKTNKYRNCMLTSRKRYYFIMSNVFLDILTRYHDECFEKIIEAICQKQLKGTDYVWKCPDVKKLIFKTLYSGYMEKIK
jgi:hypothetical protein